MLVALVIWTIPSIKGALADDDLDYRYWRNIETGKAFKAALLAFDKPTGQIQLGMSDGKKFVVKLADYHAEDKEYVKEWLDWKADEAKRAVARGASGRAPDAAADSVKKALNLRLRINERGPRNISKGGARAEAMDNEIVVQLGTSKNATNIPKGELHVVAYIAHELRNAQVKSGQASPARDADSTVVREVKPKSKKITAFKPGQTTDHIFNVTTKNVDGRQAGEKNKKTKGKKGKKTKPKGPFSWKYHQSIVGVRARLLIGGKLAAETSYPTDLDRQIERIRD